MTAAIATQVPATLIAGDTWKWTRDLTDYPAGTWTLAYYFENSSATFTVTATASGTTHSVTVAAATTAPYRAGRYRWYARANSGAEYYTVANEFGWMDVLADPAAAGKFDRRSHARKVLDAVEATIEGRATSDQLAMSIAGRSISRTPITELITLRDKYRWEVMAEQDAEALAAGLGSKKRIFVRMSRG